MMKRFFRTTGFLAALAILVFCLIQPGLGEQADELNAKLEELRNAADRMAAIDGKVVLEFEKGGFNAATGTIIFGERGDRLRNKDNRTVRLYAGDTVYCDEGTEFYLAFTTPESRNWTDLAHWYSVHTIETTGDYEIMLRDTANPNAEITDPESLARSLHIELNSSVAKKVTLISGSVTALRTDLEALRDTVNEQQMDLYGIYTIPAGSFPADPEYQAITVFDAARGETYTFSMTLEEASAGPVYLYLLDSQGQFIESDGSLTDIGQGQTEKIFSKTMKEDHPGAVFALKAAQGCRIASASIMTDDCISKALHSAVSGVSSLIAKAANLSERLAPLDGAVEPDFEIGSYVINGQEIAYFDNNQNVRIRDRQVLHLKPGDEITSEDGTEFYIAYAAADGIWTDGISWRSSYTIQTEADYQIKIRYTPVTEITDAGDLGGKLRITLHDGMASRMKSLEADMKEVMDVKDNLIDTGRELRQLITGQVIGHRKAYAGSAGFQDLSRVDLTAGLEYEFSVILEETPDAPVYFYLLNERDEYVESDGSLVSIPTEQNAVAFSRRFESGHEGVRFALKAAKGCVVSQFSITTGNSVVSRLTDAEQRMASYTGAITQLRKNVFDVSGRSEIRDVSVAAGNEYTDLYTIDLKAGVAYTVSVELASGPEDGMVYGYLLDPESGFLGKDGSLFAIPAGERTGRATVTLDASCENARFAVKCPKSAFTISAASVTFSPDGDDEYPVPDYYFADNYLPNKIGRINQLAMDAGADGDVFIFITDEHLTQNVQHSPALIKYISDRTHIARLFDAGDDADGGNEDWARTLRKVISGKAYFAMGNHEWFNDRTGGELYYMYDSANDDEIGNPDRHYFYVDDRQAKTRYIVLSAFAETEIDQGYDGAHKGYEEEQVAWFRDTALDVEEGWTIIVISHAFYYGNFSSHTWYLLDFSEAIIKAADSYTGPGKIAFMMQGHLHADGINYTPGGIPVIATTSDKQKHWVKGDLDMEEFLSHRVPGTTSEQAFDVVIHNKKTKTIYCVRIGGFATFDGQGLDELYAAGERVFTYE